MAIEEVKLAPGWLKREIDDATAEVERWPRPAPAKKPRRTVYEGAPIRHWAARRGNLDVGIVQTKTYRTIMKAVGQAIRAGGSVEFKTRIVDGTDVHRFSAPKGPGVIHEVADVVIEWA